MDILSSCTFELEDIEIIDHKTENEEKLVKWQCDQCSLFFLEKEKLAEHKKKHGEQETVKCKYCSKKIPNSSENRECFVNRKCETCEYKCSKCPQRFLRHSSLMNHEKKHSSPKKKKTFSVNKANGVAAENIVPSKVLKRKLTEAYDSEEQSIKKPRKILNPKNSPKKKEAINVKAHNSLTIESACNKMSKRMSLKSSKSPEGKSNVENTSSKTPKRISSKTNKLPEEKNSDIKVKHNSITINSTTFPSTSNVTPNSENVVNYKPFSCHVCGDTFASDSALLDHIRTHGESAAKTFQCKFCSDKFDDIYKMQYHLAICPLAEDELESSLKRVIPANIPLKYSGGTSSPRKRGRPKKTKEFSLDQTDNDNESTPFSKRGTFRKRKSEIKEIGEKLQVSSSPVLPKQKKLHQKAPLTGSNSNTTEDDAVVGAIIADVKESEPNGDKKKLHHCPFPRCDFKFTREKALLCHMRNHSDDFEDSLKCHKCDIPFDDIHTLRLHINTCKGIKEERDEDFSRAGCYDSSPNRTSIKAKKDFLCIPCGRSYQNQEKLNRCTHEKMLQSEGSTICRICSVETKDENALRKHFKSSHVKRLPYQCPTCKLEFDSSSAELEHRMTHVKKEKQFTCVICSSKFPTYKHLYFHYSKDHVEQSENICKICNITFANQMELEEHNYVKHQSKDRFKCIFCHKVYSNSVCLTVHMKSHTSKIFKCKICYRPFTDMSSLFQHMLFHASTLKIERPLKCAVCLAAYAKQSALKSHISGHITEKMSYFDCIICGEILPDYESMSDHLFDHSIRITENNMTGKETAWVNSIKKRGKEKDSLANRGRPRLSSNNDPDFKPYLENQIEKRRRGRPKIVQTEESPGIRHEVKTEDSSEVKCRVKTKKTPGLKCEVKTGKNLGMKRGRRGQCEEIQKMKHEETEKPPGMKKGKSRPKNNENRKPGLSVITDFKVSEVQKQRHGHNTRRSRQSAGDNYVKDNQVCKEIKEEEGDEVKSIKVPKLTTIGDAHSVITDEETDVTQSDFPSNVKRNCLRSRTTVSSSHVINSSHKNLNEDVLSKLVTVQTSLGGKKNEARSHNHYTPPTKNAEVNDISKTKVRPMSFKIFSSLSNTRAPKLAKELRNVIEAKEHNSYSNNLDFLEIKEEIFDEEDPLEGIEIPYVLEGKDLRRSPRCSNGDDDSDSLFDTQKLTTPNQDKENQFYEGESKNSNGFIKETKYFEPSRGLTEHSCTTCLLSFSSQEELMFHNTTHIL